MRMTYGCMMILIGGLLLSPAPLLAQASGVPDMCDGLHDATPGLYGLCVTICSLQNNETQPSTYQQRLLARLKVRYARTMRDGDPALPCDIPKTLCPMAVGTPNGPQLLGIDKMASVNACCVSPLQSIEHIEADAGVGTYHAELYTTDAHGVDFTYFVRAHYTVPVDGVEILEDPSHFHAYLWLDKQLGEGWLDAYISNYPSGGTAPATPLFKASQTVMIQEDEDFLGVAGPQPNHTFLASTPTYAAYRQCYDLIVTQCTGLPNYYQDNDPTTACVFDVDGTVNSDGLADIGGEKMKQLEGPQEEVNKEVAQVDVNQEVFQQEFFPTEQIKQLEEQVANP